MTDMRGRNSILSRFWHGGALVAAMLALPVLTVPAAAHADVVAQVDDGFVSRTIVAVDASPATVWKRLIDPAAWWSSDHTFSGDAANLSLDPVAGGCFCERLPGEAKAGKPGPARGGVQHMRVVFVDQAKALRLIGALGPLQSEAVNATLTITLKPVGKGTRILFEYVVGGYMRYPIDKISDAVDTMLGGQVASLAKPYATIDSGEAPAPAPVRRAGPEKPDSGGGLGPDGLLVPRGRIWSLPPSGGAGQPVSQPSAQPVPGPVAAPQDDSPPAPVPAPKPAKSDKPQAKSKPTPKPAPEPRPEPQAGPKTEPQPAPVEATPAEPAPPSPSPAPPKPERPAKSRPAKAARPAPATTPDEPSKADVNSAFDQVLGGGSPAPVTPP